MYETGMAVPVAMRATALYYLCDEELSADHMRELQSDVSSISEVDLLAAIDRLAVKDESTLVHRKSFNKMAQAPGTLIRAFLASLKGQATLCQYTARCRESGCEHTYDIRAEIIGGSLVRGIADPEILNDILGDIGRST